MRLSVSLTWNLFTATAPSDSDLTASGVTFRAKVIELKTATTVKAWDKGSGDVLVLSGATPTKAAIAVHQEVKKVAKWNKSFNNFINGNE